MKFYYKVQCQYCGDITNRVYLFEKEQIIDTCKICQDTNLKIINKDNTVDYYSGDTPFEKKEEG